MQGRVPERAAPDTLVAKHARCRPHGGGRADDDADRAAELRDPVAAPPQQVRWLREEPELPPGEPALPSGTLGNNEPAEPRSPPLPNAGRRQERVDVGNVTARYETRSVPAGAIAIEREVQSKRPTRDAFPPYKTGVGKDF